MKNISLEGRSRDLSYGPRAGRGRRRAMSAPRADVLDRLTGQPEPITVAALARATGLHENTVRGHLDALVADRLVRRERRPATGRGRPAWLYQAIGGPSADADAEPGYAGLAAALAGQIHRASADPRADALAAGQRWGRELALAQQPELAADGRVPAGAASARAEGDSAPATDPRARVVDLLDELGFGPRSDQTRTLVKLTRCPLLEAAHQYPDVVCAVHLGIVRGALEVYGGEPDRTDLVAFAEPGACRLDLAAEQAPAG